MSVHQPISASDETRDNARSSGRTVPGGTPLPPPGTTTDRAARYRQLLTDAGLGFDEIERIMEDLS